MNGTFSRVLLKQKCKIGDTDCQLWEERKLMLESEKLAIYDLQ